MTMDSQKQTREVKQKEDVRHVSEIAFDNPVYERDERPIILKEDVNFDFSMVPHSIKFRDKTKEKRKKICYMCAVWLLLIFVLSLVIVLVAFSTRSKEKSTVPKTSLQSRMILGQFTILNMEYEPVYADMRSKQYRTLTDNLLQLLNDIVRKTVMYSEVNTTEIDTLSPGSIKVSFVTTFLSTYDSNYLQSTVSEAFQEQTMVRYSRPQWITFLGPYHIDDDWMIRAVPVEEEDEERDRSYIIEGCEQIISPVCAHQAEVPYSTTTMPNYLGHRTMLIADMFLAQAQTVIESKCYEYSRRFLCSIALPQCDNGNRIPPCRSMCQDFFRKCRSQTPAGLHFLDCEDFPQSRCIDAPEIADMALYITPSGSVSIHIDGTYRYVCGRGWSVLDAQVICSQLNKKSVVRTWTESTDSMPEGLTWMILNCVGTEQEVSQCEIVRSVESCDERAMIECSQHRADKEDMSVRLSGGPDTSQGRLEVYYADEWGTVCDDKFDHFAAIVVCRMLGFRDIRNIRITEADRYVLLNEHTRIWLDNVRCHGNESTLSECSHNNYGDHNCVHKEDVALMCNATMGGDVYEVTSPSTTLSTTVVDTQDGTSGIPVRLQDGPNDNKGRLEVYYNGSWGSVCNTLFSDNTASVFCRQMGYRTGLYEFTRYGAGVGPIWLTEVVCQGHEQSFQDCTYDMANTQDCTHIDDASISCEK